MANITLPNPRTLCIPASNPHTKPTSAMADETPVSPVRDTKPELTLTSASINNEPVELDSTPASPEHLRAVRRGSKPAALEELSPEEQEVHFKQRIETE